MEQVKAFAQANPQLLSVAADNAEEVQFAAGLAAAQPQAQPKRERATVERTSSVQIVVVVCRLVVSSSVVSPQLLSVLLIVEWSPRLSFCLPRISGNCFLTVIDHHRSRSAALSSSHHPQSSARSSAWALFGRSTPPPASKESTSALLEPSADMFDDCPLCSCFSDCDFAPYPSPE